MGLGVFLPLAVSALPEDHKPQVGFSLGGPALTLGGIVVANVLDGVSDHPLVVHHGHGRDLTAQQHHARLTHRLCEGGKETG